MYSIKCTEPSVGGMYCRMNKYRMHATRDTIGTEQCPAVVSNENTQYGRGTGRGRPTVTVHIGMGLELDVYCIIDTVPVCIYFIHTGTGTSVVGYGTVRYRARSLSLSSVLCTGTAAKSNVTGHKLTYLLLLSKILNECWGVVDQYNNLEFALESIRSISIFVQKPE